MPADRNSMLCLTLPHAVGVACEGARQAVAQQRRDAVHPRVVGSAQLRVQQRQGDTSRKCGPGTRRGEQAKDHGASEQTGWLYLLPTDRNRRTPPAAP